MQSTLLFDLDATLVHPPDDGDERLAAAFAAADVDPFFTIEEFARRIPTVEAEGPLDLRLRCFRAIARDVGEAEAAAERVARAFEPPAASEFVPAAGASETVRGLRDRGHDVALVTNGPEARQREKLRLLDLEDAFDATVFGDPDRGLKPDPAPFRTALEALSAAPTEAVKIGDRPAVDIEPAARLGLGTVWVPPGDPAAHEAEVAADAVVADLAELLDEPWR